MQIVVNHLTRMRGERICIAGIDPESGRHVRPVCADEQVFTRDLLRPRGGPVTLRSLVDLGPAQPSPERLMSEDFDMNRSDLSLMRDLEAGEYHDLLEAVRLGMVSDLIGANYERRPSGSIAITPGMSLRSLGVFRRFTRGLKLKATAGHDAGPVRLELTIEGGPASLPITDLRLYASSGSIVRSRVDELNELLLRYSECYLMLGLTQPWPEDNPVHWLQVNGFEFIST